MGLASFACATDIEANDQGIHSEPLSSYKFAQDVQWVQTNKVWEPDQAWQQGGFHRNALENVFFRQAETTIWFRFVASEPVSESFWVSTSQLGIESFSFYFRTEGSPWQLFEPIDLTNHFSNLNIQGDLGHAVAIPQDWTHMLLRVTTTSNGYTDLVLNDMEEHLERALGKRLWVGALYALLIGLALFFLVTCITLKSKPNLWLSLACLLLLLTAAAVSGESFNLLGHFEFISVPRSICVSLVLAAGCSVYFMNSRYLVSHSRSVLLGKRVDGVTWFAFLCMTISLPLWGAVMVLLIFVGLSGFGMAYMGYREKLPPTERFLMNLSHVLMAVLSAILSLHFWGHLSFSDGVMSAVGILLILIPVTWALSVSRIYRQLRVDHNHAHREWRGSENQLQEAFEARLQIFSSIAHHLNNPLNYILLGVAKARDELGDVQRRVNMLFEHADENSEALQIKQGFDNAFGNCHSLFGDALLGVQRAARVVDEMRGLTNIDGDTIELVPVADILSSMKSRVVDDLGKKMIQPVTLNDKIQSNEPCNIYGNPYLVIHALKNIVKNGYLFARRSSSVRPTLELKLDDRCPEGFIRLVVSNNGPAIAIEHEPIIFRMGFSSYGRRGTGLNVSQSILRETGGKVVLNDHGRESGWVRFSVLLPTQEVLERSLDQDVVL